MKRRQKHLLMGLVLVAALVCILLPVVQMLLWSVAGRWPWPSLLPESYSLRSLRELLWGTTSLPRLLVSSIALALAVGVLGTVIGAMTARATQLYAFPGRELIRSAVFLPLLVPGTVFAMGIQIVMIRMGLSDTVFGVLLVHLIAALPYCVSIMADVTRAVGIRHEEQAAVLGARPWQGFLMVTLPQLLPGILSSVCMGFILSYSQYFTTLMVGGGRVRTLALVLVPYIQNGDRSLTSAYATAFVGSALLAFFVFEGLIRSMGREERER